MRRSRKRREVPHAATTSGTSIGTSACAEIQSTARATKASSSGAAEVERRSATWLGGQSETMPQSRSPRSIRTASAKASRPRRAVSSAIDESGVAAVSQSVSSLSTPRIAISSGTRTWARSQSTAIWRAKRSLAAKIASGFGIGSAHSRKASRAIRPAPRTSDGIGRGGAGVFPAAASVAANASARRRIHQACAPHSSYPAGANANDRKRPGPSRYSAAIRPTARLSVEQTARFSARVVPSPSRTPVSTHGTPARRSSRSSARSHSAPITAGGPARKSGSFQSSCSCPSGTSRTRTNPASPAARSTPARKFRSNSFSPSITSIHESFGIGWSGAAAFAADFRFMADILPQPRRERKRATAAVPGPGLRRGR